MSRHLEELIFCRHGETESNVNGWLAGSIDIDLTERGRAQAAEAAQLLREEAVAGIYTSPMRRARETADIIAAVLGQPVVTVDGLQERYWGELEGGAIPADIITWRDVPGGESMAEFEARVTKALRSICQPAAGEGLPLIIAHAGTAYAIQRILGLPEASASLPNARPVRMVAAEQLVES